MTLSLKFDYNKICNLVLEEKLKAHNFKYRITRFGEVDVLEKISNEQLKSFSEDISEYGIEILENPKIVLVQKIKDAIHDMVFNQDTVIQVKTSVYLSDKLNLSYAHLSNVFSEVTYTSIENYLIIQKIEYTKMLIAKEQLTLTEIAFKLDYSSVAHLSRQFKNTTGITPSAFQRIINKRKTMMEDNNQTNE
ncbi:helix-turn-helix domain-containing protein [Psychroserpens mesophilus]|uniref:helix-turn-helix domain-containing protein n=1 Tax=Psychroserpens mesophilus TaxID=325473 RepID=UPI003D649E3D